MQKKFEKATKDKDNLRKAGELNKEASDKIESELKSRIQSLESECNSLQVNVSELKEGETKFKKQFQDSETQDAEKTKQYHECIAEKDAIISQLKKKL